MPSPAGPEPGRAGDRRAAEDRGNVSFAGAAVIGRRRRPREALVREVGPAGTLRAQVARPSSRTRAKTAPVSEGDGAPLLVRVRRLHRRDLNRAWEFVKLVFRDVNRETVEYQRPRSKRRFLDIYDEEEVEQLLFERKDGTRWEIVGYAECTLEPTASDNWINPRFFGQRDMRPLFVEELAVHPGYQGRGIGAFALQQLEHLARLRGATHLVLEVAENNRDALRFYRACAFHKLDASIFLAKRVPSEAELLPPRRLGRARGGSRSRRPAPGG